MSEKRIIFRCDANEMIGGGHLMRCIALAEACSELGMRPIFATQPLAAADHHRLLSRGFVHRPIPAPEHQSAWLAQSRAKAVVVDRYGLPDDYLDAWRASGERPALHIVDGDQALAGANIVLNQNLDAKVATQAHQTPLLGLRYALLRREFRMAQPLVAENAVQRVMLTLGASDPDGRTLGLIGALESVIRWHGLRLCLVIGPHNRQADSLRRQAAQRSWIEVCEDVGDMAALMSTCQIAVSAAGSTLWEMCAVGLPRIVMTIAPNQEPLAEAAARHGAAIHLGDAADLDPERLTQALEGLIQDPPARQAQAKAGRGLVDGQGALRVAQTLEEQL